MIMQKNIFYIGRRTEGTNKIYHFSKRHLIHYEISHSFFSILHLQVSRKIRKNKFNTVKIFSKFSLKK